LLTAFGVGTVVLGSGMMAYGTGFYMYFGLIVATIIMVIYFMAFTPLRARKRAGWNLLYYALIISLVSNLLQLALFAFKGRTNAT